MTEAQRVGQLFLVGIAGEPAADVAQAVRTYHFGNLLWQGTSAAGLAVDQQDSQAIQALASFSATSGVRFFIAANQEGGQVQELQGPGFTGSRPPWPRDSCPSPNCSSRPRPGAASCGRRASTSTWPR